MTNKQAITVGNIIISGDPKKGLFLTVSDSDSEQCWAVTKDELLDIEKAIGTWKDGRETICACSKPADKERIENEWKKGWQTIFKGFYDDNEAGGSSRWLVAPNTVQNFIKSLLNSPQP